MRGWVVRGFGAALAAVVLAAGWWFLAPAQLGGRTAYAVTFGVSMEPHFRRGDLVVLRARPSYAVGDVVAYRSRDLGRNVLHRIIAIRNGRYTFKGDNNGFVDPEQPVAADLVGSEWLRIPNAGAWLASLHTPRNAAIAAFAIVLALLLSGGGTVAVRRRRRRSRPPAEKRALRRPSPPLGSGASAGFVVAGLGAGALVAAAGLGSLAFTRPPEKTVVWPNLYVQRGTFGYAARVPRGATYQRRVLRSGDPVYVRIVRRLPVSFDYRLRGEQPSGVAGTIALDAFVRDSRGWSYRIVLAPRRPFAGTSVRAGGTLDFARIQKVIAAFERETGEHNTLYRLTLAATVAVHGTVGARPVATTFAPTLAFELDQIRLAVSVPTDPAAPPNAFAQAKSGAATRLETATLSAFGRAVTVLDARRLAKLLGIAGLALAGLGGLLVLAGRRANEVATIRRRYEDWIVEVTPGERPAASERRVASIDALARLAERYDRLILHESRDDGDAFLVEDDGIVYAYLVRNWERPVVVAP